MQMLPKSKIIRIVYNFAHPWYQHMVQNTIALDHLRTILPLGSSHESIGTPSNLLMTRTMKMGKLMLALVGRSVTLPTCTICAVDLVQCYGAHRWDMGKAFATCDSMYLPTTGDI